MPKYYFIYKVINKVNGRFYYGKHCTSRLDDGYMGSGIAIRAAIRKYGIENFERKILKFYSSDEELCIAEARLVNKKWLAKNSQCYNMKPGGKGGFQKGLWQGRKRSAENKQRLSKSLLGHAVSQATRDKISAKNTGKTRDAASIEKARASLKKTLAEKGIWNKGKKCPQVSGSKNGGGKKFKGTHYYNNGSVEIRAFECPEGFVKGGLPKRQNG